MSLEEIDLMFGDRALGALPTDLTDKNGEDGATTAYGDDRFAVA